MNLNMKKLRYLILSALIVLTSCEKNDELEALEKNSINVTLTSGDEQTATVGVTLVDAIEVTVKDQSGVAIEGANVNFEVTEGSVSSANMTTDANGKATVTWTLGANEGSQTLTVIAFKTEGTSTIASSPLSVTASAEPVVILETWKLIGAFTDSKNDFNGDGIATNNLLEETNCAADQTIRFNSDGTGNEIITKYFFVEFDESTGIHTTFCDSFSPIFEAEFTWSENNNIRTLTSTSGFITFNSMASLSGTELSIFVQGGFFITDDQGNVYSQEDVTFFYSLQ